MSKYWQENPNHKVEWGESGGLPISKLTIGEENRPRVWNVLDVALVTDNTDAAVVDDNEDFVLSGDIDINYGGAEGNIPNNARERQLERELPASSPATIITKG